MYQISCKKEEMFFTQLNTPLGPMFAVADSVGICLLEFTDQSVLENESKKLEKQSVIASKDHVIFCKLHDQLQEYFQGKRRQFDISLSLYGSLFQKKVWHELQTIPFGTTSTYQTQAINIQQPTAYRAVANANGKNKIAILIPCHRVIAKNGELAGYNGGIWRKKYLLDLEQSSA